MIVITMIVRRVSAPPCRLRRSAGFLLLPGLIGWPAMAQERPNIVVIMADDLGWGDVGYNGSEIATPTLDRMAAGGVRLDRYYTHPSCTPSRTAFYTGKRPLSLGAIVPPGPPWEDFGLPREERILPQYLQEAGYTTLAGRQVAPGPPLLRSAPAQSGLRSLLRDQQRGTELLHPCAEPRSRLGAQRDVRG